MKTIKLYHHDSYKKEFNAKVLQRGEINGEHYVVLDKTAFYPEGGGQPWDLGYINGLEVTRVVEEDDVIYHYLKQSVDNDEIQGMINWQRRFDHMQQHLGQHILSAAFQTLFDASTVGFHLSQEYVSIDVALKELNLDMLAQVEDFANSAIYDNHRVKCYVVNNEEIKKLPLRKPPTVEDNIRIVEVEAIDFSGCAGTHPSTTGEVGIIKVTGFEKSKGNVRVFFICGHRALRDYRQKNLLIQQCAASLSLPFFELKEGIDSLNNELSNIKKVNKQLSLELSQYRAQDYYSKSKQQGDLKIVTSLFNNEDFNQIKTLSSFIVDKERVVALFGNLGQKGQLIFSCSKDVNMDMNNLLKQVLPLINGTGGGNRFCAQGGSTEINNIEKALGYAEQLVLSSGDC
jgi:alanyl-tRNA synthetase